MDIPRELQTPQLKPDLVDVPRELQTPRIKTEPDRTFGFNIEEYFGEWMNGQVDDRYLPVYWWNNAATGYLERHGGPFYAIPEVQAFVDALPPGQYFTVSRGADGPYERLPPGVVVFSAGGRGDFPIPHLAEIEYCTVDPLTRPRDLLASFVGNIECGGPEVPRPIGRSSWNPDGVGAQLRRRMVAIFRGEPNCFVKPQVVQAWTGLGLAAHTNFCDIAKRSWFGLAPRGYGKTSYRLYEMIALGTIPVYLYDEPWLPYLDQLDWTEFAVLCHTSEMDGLPARLRSIPEAERLRMIARGQELLPDYFTPDSVCKQIMRYVSLL